MQEAPIVTVASPSTQQERYALPSLLGSMHRALVK